jgi:hypothetical protein
MRAITVAFVSVNDVKGGELVGTGGKLVVSIKIPCKSNQHSGCFAFLPGAGCTGMTKIKHGFENFASQRAHFVTRQPGSIWTG